METQNGGGHTQDAQDDRTFGIILCDSYYRFGKGRRVVEYRYGNIIDVGYAVDITEYANYKNTHEEYSTREAAEAAV